MAGRVVALVVNWNGRQITLDCLASLVASGVAEEDVLVVDNGSTDGSTDAIREAHPRARQLELPENRGFAGGCNAGLRALLDDPRVAYVLLLNNDTLATPGLVDGLAKTLDAEPDAAIAQPKIVFFDRTTVENAGGECDRYGVTWPRGRGDAAKASSYPREGFFYANLACALVRAEALREVGLFDEAYFCYHEDVDLGWRLRLAGWRIVCEDALVCYHDESRTAGRAPTKIGLIWRNRYRTLLKNYGPARLALRLLAAVALTTAHSLAAAVRQRDARFPWLQLKALAWNARHLRSTLRERRKTQRLRRVRDRDVERHFTRGLVELRFARERRPP